MKYNSTLLTDFYELTMAKGYFENDMKDQKAYFDMFFRRVPDNGGFAIMAGVEQLVDYLNQLHFTEEDIAFLRSKKIFNEAFLSYLLEFKFECDVWAIKEGTPIFPNEPIITVYGPIIQAQLIETMVLLIINHQSLIATKANRIVRAAKGRPVIEFGSRRAQGADGALYGARAAYIGGCAGTACTVAEQLFGIPASGTMAHSWVQMFDSELEAFKTYARTFPNDCTLLIDTYSVINTGIPNAIKAFNEEVLPRGFRPKGVRIDSGDITYLSIKARKMLDEAGFPDCQIIASNSLDELIIRDLLLQEAKIDVFGVGERLITSKSEPVFGGVYKLVATEKYGQVIPKIKISENVEKITNPAFKQVWRLYNRTTHKAIADVLTLANEKINDLEAYEIFDPDYTWKRKTITDFYAKPLLEKLFENGKSLYVSEGLGAIKDYCTQAVDSLWEEVKRFENPHKYYVDLSLELWQLKQDLLKYYIEK